MSIEDVVVDMLGGGYAQIAPLDDLRTVARDVIGYLDRAGYVIVQREALDELPTVSKLEGLRMRSGQATPSK